MGLASMRLIPSRRCRTRSSGEEKAAASFHEEGRGNDREIGLSALEDGVVRLAVLDAGCGHIFCAMFGERVDSPQSPGDNPLYTGIEASLAR